MSTSITTIHSSGTGQISSLVAQCDVIKTPISKIRFNYVPSLGPEHFFFKGELHHSSTFSSGLRFRETSELHFKPHFGRDYYSPSSLKNVGSNAKQNVAPDNVNSRSDEDVNCTDGSSISNADSELRSYEEHSDEFLSKVEEEEGNSAGPDGILETLILICPFFLWGTAMVAMKGLLPRAGPMFVASVRLIPAGFLLVSYGALSGKKQPRGLMAWLSIALFGLVDASCFQGFLVEGLKRTSAGLGSVIIDSQPLTVAILAAVLFGESLALVNYMGLAFGIAGLLLLEVPLDSFQSLINGSPPPLSDDIPWVIRLVSWDGGEWRMLVAAQSMAVGTVMVRWVCKYSDPFMATGWHMVLGGAPLLVLSVLQQDPAVTGHIQDLTFSDWSALFYTSVGGSAISYGVFFYNACRGSLTKLSSLTFLTPMFAALFGFLFLSETIGPVQCLGGAITLGGVLLVNYKPSNAAMEVDDASKKS